MSQIQVLVSDLQGGSDNQVKNFVLSATCDTKKWNINRSTSDLRDLHTQLSSSSVAEKVPPLVLDDECTIQQFFNQLLCNLGEIVWDIPSLLSFLDNIPVKSAISLLHIERLTQKIKELESCTNSIQKTVEDVNQKYDHLMSLINGQSSTGSVSSSSKSADDNWKSSHGSHGRSNSHGRERGSRKWHPSQSSIEEGDKATAAAAVSTGAASALRRTHLDDDSSDSDDDDDGADYFDEEGISASVRPYLLKPSLTSSAVVPSSVGQNIFPSNDQLEQYTRMTHEVLRCVQPYESTVQYRNSAISFIKKLIKTATNCNAFDVTLHELRCALPDDIIRVSVIMNKNDGSVNNTWHKSILEKLNLAAERTVTENTSLNMAVRYEDESGGSGGDSTGASGVSALPIITHSICNVQLTSNPVNYQVNCLIDNSLPVEIIVNDRIDMVFQAFFEEFSQLVGKDHLFKKSLLMVRAWWIYETSAYVGTSIKQCISDNSITIMLIAVFNQFHQLIESPVQALCMFLTEYSNFDGSSHAITIQGLVPFKDINSNVPILSPPKPDQLLSPLLIEKYWKIFNVHAPESSTVTSTRTMSVDRNATVQDFQVGGGDDRGYGHGVNNNNSSHHSFNNSTHSFNNGSTHSFPNNSAHSHHSHGFNNNSTHSTHSFNNGSTHSHRSMGFGNDSTHSQHSYHSHTSNHSITNSTACMLFERADFSIVCPFDHTNMMPASGNYTVINNNRENMAMERLSNKQISLMNKAFTVGANALSGIVKHNNKAFAAWEEKHLSSKTTTLTEEELMKDLLSNINHDVGMTNLLSDTVSSQGSSSLQNGSSIGGGGGSVGGLEIEGLESVVSFFPILMTRLGGSWRPDAVNNTVEQEKENNHADLLTGILSSEGVKARSLNKMRELMNGSLGSIWQNILYTNLILENVLTESALLTLSCEILTDRGPLPVGEIGKMLSEITTFPHFTARLKEKFGGLKKFLENFPHIIYISTDHPFNPNVLLRSSVTPEQLDMIEKGALPIQSVIKSKKAAITAATAAYAQSKKKGGGGGSGGGGAGGNNNNNLAGMGQQVHHMQMQQQQQQQLQHSQMSGGIGSLLMPSDDNLGLLSYRSTPTSVSSPGSAQNNLYNSTRSPTGAISGQSSVSMGYATAAKSPPLSQMNQQLHLQQQQQQHLHQQNQHRNLSGGVGGGFNAVPGSFGGQYFDAAPEEDFAIGSAGAYQLDLGGLGQRGGGGGGNSELSALRESSYELGGGYGGLMEAQLQLQQQQQQAQLRQSTQKRQQMATQQQQQQPFGGVYGSHQQQQQQQGLNQNNAGYRTNRMF